jgi:lipid-A-disaccharide synthase
MGPAAPTSLIYLIAGEASGDVLGARLISALRARRPGLRFAGIGGPRMAEQGLESLFPLADLAVMGLLEVLPRLRHLSRRLAETVADVARRRPAVVVTIDSPGFTLRVLRRISSLGIPRVHYVAPQVWAWRESRVRRYPGLWEKLLCLLPFEPGFFQSHGLTARFVGHPVLESGAGTGEASRFRAAHGLTTDRRIVVLMPGSRRSEVTRLLPVFERTLEVLGRPDVVPVVPVSSVVAATVLRATSGWFRQPIVVTELAAKHDAFAAADAALTKSGTSTLELALAGVPMAVTYRVNPLTATLVRRLIRVPHVAMVNLLAGQALVPELLQGNCNATTLARTLAALLDDPVLAARQRSGFAGVLEGLRAPGGLASDAAALEVLALL